jgi:hypothetical protein
MNEDYRQYLLDGQNAGLRYGLAVPRKVKLGLVGSQLGNRCGSSLEFMDHRAYIPGDDLRRIDWGAYARSNKLSVKLYRDEVLPHLDLVIDRLTHDGAPDTTKAQAALGLAAMLAQAARNSNYSFQAWTIGRMCEKIENGALAPVLWDGFDFGFCGSCAEGFGSSVPAWKPRSIRIFISDLMWMGDPFAALSMLSDQSSAVFVCISTACRGRGPCRRQTGNVRLQRLQTQQFEENFR